MVVVHGEINMTQPQRQPEQPKPPHNPERDPFYQDSLSLPGRPYQTTGTRRASPSPQASPTRFDPLDQLANDLHELGLFVRREAFLDGVTWNIVANQTAYPYKKVQVRLGERVTSESSENLLTISVRLNALRPDCEAASVRAKNFIRTIYRK